MARQRSSRPFTGLRRALLAALVLVVLAVAGLYLFGRAGRTAAPRPSPTASEGIGAGGDITAIGEGFELSFTEKDREIFHIRGDQMRADREDTVYLEGVALSFETEDRERFEIEADRAAYNRGEKEARLSGSVRLAGGDGLELVTETLELTRQGEVVQSRAPVGFRLGQGYVGTAQRLRADLPLSLYLVGGDVRIRSTGSAPNPIALSANRVFLEREKSRLVAEGKAELRHGDDLLRAFRINAFLTDDLENIRFLGVRGEVSGHRHLAAGKDGAASRLTFAGESLLALFRPGGELLERMDLEAPGRGRVQLSYERPGESTSRLSAVHVTSRFDRGGAQRIEAFGSPVLTESTPGGGETRRLTGERLEARVSTQGTFTRAELTGGVTYRDEQWSAEGERGVFDLAGGLGELTGDPVRLISERGEMVAPHVIYNAESGILHADRRGGDRRVRARFTGETAKRFGGTLPPAGGGEAAGEEPVQVEADHAFWRESPRSFLFTGDVRAWRGDTVLLAGELRGDEEDERLLASGGVRTAWRPAPREGEARSSGDAVPIEVTAETLNYRRIEGLAVYEGDVQVERERRVLTCRELTVRLDAQDRAESMTCRGDVRLTDPVSGNRATAEEALYTPGRAMVELTGSPAVVTSQEGGVVQAAKLYYDLEAGRVLATGRFQGEPGPPAEVDGGGGETP